MVRRGAEPVVGRGQDPDERRTSRGRPTTVMRRPASGTAFPTNGPVTQQKKNETKTTTPLNYKKKKKNSTLAPNTLFLFLFVQPILRIMSETSSLFFFLKRLLEIRWEKNFTKIIREKITQRNYCSRIKSGSEMAKLKKNHEKSVKKSLASRLFTIY